MGRREIIKERVLNWIEEFNAELSRSFPGLTIRFPLDRCVEDFKSYNVQYSSSCYNNISSRLKRNSNQLENQYGKRASSLYLKLLLSSLIFNTLGSASFKDLPHPLKELSKQWFEMICNDFANQSDSYYSHNNALFCLDLSVCNLKALPVGGAWFIELVRRRENSLLKPYAISLGNVSRRRQINVALKTLLIKLNLYDWLFSVLDRGKQLKSYYIIHTVDRFLPRFTEENMAMAYMNIAKLLIQNPDVAGICRRSWLLDPNLKEISPSISYLWEIPQQNGANLTRVGPCGKLSTQNAIFMSPVRKKLYETGKYIPTTYAYLWNRKDVMNWAQKRKS